MGKPYPNSDLKEEKMFPDPHLIAFMFFEYPFDRLKDNTKIWQMGGGGEEQGSKSPFSLLS